MSEKSAAFRIICSVWRTLSDSCQLLWGFLGRGDVFQCPGLTGGRGSRFPALARKEQEVAGLPEGPCLTFTFIASSLL